MAQYDVYKQQLRDLQSECYQLNASIKQLTTQLESKERQVDLLMVALKAVEEEREAVEKEKQEAALKAKEAEAGKDAEKDVEQPDEPITPPDLKVVEKSTRVEAIDEKSLETPSPPPEDKTSSETNAKKKGNSNPVEGDK